MRQKTQLASRRLTWAQILEIRKRYAAGQTQLSLACQFHTSQPNISQIVLGRTYKHSPAEELERRSMINRARLIRRRITEKGLPLETAQHLILLHTKCDICGKEESGSSRRKTLHLDHTGHKARGILCQSCNLGLGHFKDSVERLQKAIQYLRRAA